MDVLFQLLVFGGLFFVMMKFGCGSHMMGHGKSGGKDTHSNVGPVDENDKNLIQNGSRPPEKDIDPVCGKTVETAQAKTSLHNGLVYFFCSSDCRETFEAQPSQFHNSGNSRPLDHSASTALSQTEAVVHHKV